MLIVDKNQSTKENSFSNNANAYNMTQKCLHYMRYW